MKRAIILAFVIWVVFSAFIVFSYNGVEKMLSQSEPNEAVTNNFLTAENDPVNVIVLETYHITELEPHLHDIVDDSVDDEGHGIFVLSKKYVVPEDMWITNLKEEVHNADFSTLHHFILWEVGAENPVCPNALNLPGYPIYISASDFSQRGDIHFSHPNGIFIKKGTELFLDVMLHNPVFPYGPGQVYSDVYATVTITTEPAVTSLRNKDVQYINLVLGVDQCENYVSVPTFEVPIGESTYTFGSRFMHEKDGSQYVFQSEGQIIGLGGHIHSWEGGKNISVFINEKLNITLTQNRISDDLWSWVSPAFLVDKRINAGDSVSIETIYENTFDRPIRGAMGIVGLLFVPD